MNIMPAENNISMNGKFKRALVGVRKGVRKVGQKILDIIPDKSIQEDVNTHKRWSDVYTFLSEPARNRLVMGATALATQPVIDYYNHRVDDETRTVSRNRTISKIVAGTLVGCVVRGLVHKIAVSMTNINKHGKFANFLLPSKISLLREFIKNENSLKTYRSSIAMFAALAAMSITNFLLDAPLTTYFTNKLNKISNVQNNVGIEPSGEEKLKEGIYA